MKQKLKAAIPFIIVCLLVLYAWAQIIFTQYAATPVHYITICIVAINVVLYFFRFKAAILLTGAILVLATFNQLSFFAVTQAFGFGINLGNSQWFTPGIQIWPLLLLIVYGIINFNLLADWYLEAKEKKEQDKH